MNYDLQLVDAAANAVTQQADMMDHERALAEVRITKLKKTMWERKLEILREEITATCWEVILAHKTSEKCALEPGWDVVQ